MEDKMTKKIKDFVNNVMAVSLDTKTLIREIFGHFVTLEEVLVSMDTVRFGALTKWARELRKDDIISDESVAQIITTWIEKNTSSRGNSLTILNQILSSFGEPVVRLLLPYLMRVCPDFPRNAGSDQTGGAPVDGIPMGEPLE